MMVMQKIGKMTTEVLGEISFYSIRLRLVITISSLVLLLIFFPNSFSTTGSISGMENNATAFVGCDNGIVRTFTTLFMAKPS